uniref:Putative tail protein n=1 Tax=viral metagenome TaxID=1070528 RepID=A0A6M3IZ84_9ZZZZ
MIQTYKNVEFAASHVKAIECLAIPGDWDTEHHAASGTSLMNLFLYVGAYRDDVLTVIYRTGLIFDTSEIPEEATIESAKLKLTVADDDNVHGYSFDVVVTEGMPDYPHNPVTVDDYDITQYAGDGGSIDVAECVEPNEIEIELNSTGLSWIQKEGTTKFMLLASTDIADDDPYNDTGHGGWIEFALTGVILEITWSIGPTVVTRVAFGSDPMDAAPVWDDISGDMMQFSTKRGRQHELNRMEAGVAMVELKNTDGDYWPDNAGGSYYPDVLPRKRLNMRAVFGGTTYDLFTGFMRAWEPGWRGQAGIGAVMKAQAVDLFRNLARFELNNAGEAQELSGARVGNVLDELGWPAGDRDLDNGQTTLQATGAQAAVNSLDHLSVVQDSEMGLMFIAGDGDVQYQDRHARLKSPFTVSQATFGDDVGEQRYFEVEFSEDDEFIYNDIRRTRLGGNEQTSSDATSQTTYGISTRNLSGLLMVTDAEALAHCQYELARYKDPAMRVRAIRIYPDLDPVNLYPLVLGLDISDRITVRLNQASIDGDYHIEGVEHFYDNERWVTRWELSEASSQSYWAIGVAGFGEIGETTILVY